MRLNRCTEVYLELLEMSYNNVSIDLGECISILRINIGAGFIQLYFNEHSLLGCYAFRGGIAASSSAPEWYKDALEKHPIIEEAWSLVERFK